MDIKKKLQEAKEGLNNAVPTEVQEKLNEIKDKAKNESKKLKENLNSLPTDEIKKKWQEAKEGLNNAVPTEVKEKLKEIKGILNAPSTPKKKVDIINIMSSLFLLDFNNIDVLLITLVVNEICKNKEFEFVDSKINIGSALPNCTFDGVRYSINRSSDYLMDSNKLEYFTNEEVTSYLRNLNFKDLILKKLDLISDLDYDLQKLLISDEEQMIVGENIEFKMKKYEKKAAEVFGSAQDTLNRVYEYVKKKSGK